MAKLPAKASRASTPQFDLAMRVTLVRPPGGVQFCLQGRSANELFEKRVSTGEDLSLDLAVRVALGPSGPPRFLGPFTHGSPADRFLYVCVGTLAGQPQSCWTRRAKIPLSGITRKLVDQARRAASGRLEGRVWGTAKDGGPVCASVPLLDGGWRFIE